MIFFVTDKFINKYTSDYGTLSATIYSFKWFYVAVAKSRNKHIHIHFAKNVQGVIANVWKAHMLTF